jgi:tetratricopeptide (TPR) repeat protein
MFSASLYVGITIVVFTLRPLKSCNLFQKTGFTLTQRFNSVKKALFKVITGMRLLKIFLASLIAIWISFFTFDRQVDGWKKEADRFLAAGQSQTAEVIYHKIITAEPWRPLDWRTLAYMYARQGKPEKAIAIFEPWIRNNRLADEDVVILAQAYTDTGSPDKATELLSSAAEHATSPDGERRMLLALELLYRNDHDYDSALLCLETLRKRSLNTPESDYEMQLITGLVSPERLPDLMVLNTDTPDWLKVWASSMVSAGREPDAGRRWLMTGQAYASIGVWDLAEFAFTRSTSLSPEMADAWGMLAESRQQQGKSGADAITRALELEPDSPAVRLTAALYYRRQHDTGKAVDLLKKNIESNPGEIIWNLELGNTLAEGGKLDDAVLEFQKAVDLKPRDPAGYKAAARFSLQYGYRLEEVGLEASNSVIELEKNSAEGYDLKGQVLLALQKPEDSSAAFDTAVKKDSRYAPVWLHIGQAAIDRLDYPRAREALEKAVTLGGQSYEAQLASRLLKEYFGDVSILP